MKSSIKFGILGILVVGLCFVSFLRSATAADFKQIYNAKVGQFNPSGTSVFFEQAALVGTTAYVADFDLPGLWVISVATPSNPTLVGTATTPNPAYNIRVANNVAFLRTLTNGANGHIVCFDVSTPASPVPTGNFVAFNGVNDFQVAGNLMFIGNGSDLVSVNITNLNNPIELSRVNVTACDSVSLAGNYVYCGVSGTVDNLTIVNATNPANLTVVASLATGNFWPEAVVEAGNVAYSAGRDFNMPNGTGNIRTFNVANKSNPVALGTLVSQGISTLGVALSGTTLFTGDCLGGLLVVNVTDPIHMVPIGFFNDTCGTTGSYGQNPSLWTDPSRGQLVMWAAMSCGLMIMAGENFSFTLGIPGPDPGVLLVAAGAGATFLVFKVKRKYKTL